MILNFFNYKLSNLRIDQLFNKIKGVRDDKLRVINCINPHSFVVSLKDKEFNEALSNAYLNLIDGVGVSLYLTLSKLIKINRITGYDLFEKIINSEKNCKIFFLGSSNHNLEKIKTRLINENKECLVDYYSPPFADKFTEEENKKILLKINSFKPDYLFIGMTAPKQEKWSYENKDKINAKFAINIGAVFDYYSGNFKRPFKIIRNLGLEWLVRVYQNPKLWSRTYISLPKYIFYIIKQITIPVKPVTAKIIDDIKILNKKINNEGYYIFSAFNLAMTSNLITKNLQNENNFYYWSDGIFCKFFNRKINKIAGNKFLDNIKLNKKFESIHVLGNLKPKDKLYLNKKFLGLRLNFTELPFGQPEELIERVTKIYENSLILITLPTPKQEILAQMLMTKFKSGKIICIGGGLSIASGHEKKCPVLLENMGLEFIWRLRSETKRRVVRVTRDIIIIIFSFITFRLRRFKIDRYE